MFLRKTGESIQLYGSYCLVLSKCSLYQYFMFFLWLLFKNGASVTAPLSGETGRSSGFRGAACGREEPPGELRWLTQETAVILHVRAPYKPEGPFTRLTASQPPTQRRATRLPVCECTPDPVLSRLLRVVLTCRRERVIVPIPKHESWPRASRMYWMDSWGHGTTGFFSAKENEKVFLFCF